MTLISNSDIQTLIISQNSILIISPSGAVNRAFVYIVLDDLVHTMVLQKAIQSMLCLFSNTDTVVL